MFVLSPGDILEEEMLARDWSEHDLAEISLEAEKVVRDVIHNRTAVDEKMAVVLSKLFGTTKDFWLSLEENYQSFLRRSSLSYQHPREGTDT